MMQLSESSERSYQARMEELSKDIWKVLQFQEHYFTIRSIHEELVLTGQITKRQAVRLFDFIYDCEFNKEGNVKYYSKEDIDNAIEKIKKLHVFERKQKDCTDLDIVGNYIS